MVKDLISVILPAYNAEKYIKESIDSILRQTYKNFELIIINDGSTDGTEEIVLSYKDSRIRYVKNEKNLKLIKTLNKGVNLATGEYIARMDADDISLPNRLQIEYDFMKAHPEVSVCSSLVYRLFSNNKIVKGYYYPCKLPEGCRFTAIYKTPLSHPAAFFKAGVLKRFQYKDEAKALHIEAFVLWGDFALANENMAVIDKRLLIYRDNEQSICHSYADIQMMNHKNRVRYMLKQMLNIEISEGITDTIYALRNKYSISDITSAIDFINMSKKIYINQQRYTIAQKMDINNAAFSIKRNMLAQIYRQSSCERKFVIMMIFLLVLIRFK